ncbi:cellulase family glycosylhydrolase [Nannocystaceae bacterium ST9]
MSTRHHSLWLSLSILSLAGCPGGAAEGETSETGSDEVESSTDAGTSDDASTSEASTDAETDAGTDASTSDAETTNDGSSDTSDTTTGGDALPEGWLYTEGSTIHVADGQGSGTPWMGRGMNIDDIFFCGYNTSLWMEAPEATLQTVIANVMSDWKPNFIRMSLSMASNQTTVSWLENPEQYKVPMSAVIDAIGDYPDTYVLVVLRSDASMILHDEIHGNPEATGIPSDASTTPDPVAFPEGTDEVYAALVESFANDPHVLFGITNEPGGNLQSNETLRAVMDHAVGVIRDTEDQLGVPHHLVAVQGNGWTSDIGFYVDAPLDHDGVVYEVHGYPPSTESYTLAGLPVFIGEYGSLDVDTAPAFYADLEAKQISNLAWDLDAFSNCAPDLVEVNYDENNLVPTEWGSIVQAYLLEHAP